MFHPDLHTLLLILALNKLLLAVLLYYLKSKTPDFKGINYWANGSLITAIGIFVFAFYPYPVPIFIEFLFSFFLNVLVLLGDSLFLAGFWQLKGKIVNKTFLYIFPLLATLNVIVFTLCWHIIWLRITITTLLGFALYLISAIELLKSPNKSLSTIFKFSAAIYFFYAFLQLSRCLLAILYKPTDPLADNAISVILYAAAGISMIMLTFNVIIIITTSLNNELNEQIRAKNKLHAIISHDLRSPISDFINYIRILKQSFNSWETDKIKQWINDMEKISTSSLFLLENLLYWSRSQLNEIRVQVSENNISLTIHETIKIFSSKAQSKNIKLEFLNSKEYVALYDTNMIGVVLRNLCNNAIKFTPANGSIIFSVNEKQTSLEILITDNGIGIEADKLNLIFDKTVNYSSFGTESEKGSGFGLALCKEFIELNGGELKISSVPKKGTSVAFTLPKPVK